MGSVLVVILVACVALVWVRGVRVNRRRWLQRLGLPGIWHCAAEQGSQTLELTGEHGTARLRWRGWEAAWRSERNQPLVRCFLAAIRATGPDGTRPRYVVKTGTSDMNVVAPTWRCPILAYGPGDAALDHTPEERLSLDEYVQAIQVLTEALKQIDEVPTL